MDEDVKYIDFETEQGEKIPFEVIEETMVAGMNYLLVADGDEEEADAYILREITDAEEQKVYEMVEDEQELEALSKVFAELLDDVDIEM